jgi:lipoprotein-anchoring transpeptidase ErfK/SrfK
MRTRKPGKYRPQSGLRRALAMSTLLVALSAWLLNDGATPPSHAIVEQPAANPDPLYKPSQRIHTQRLLVRDAPSQAANILGWISPDEPFDVFGRAEGLGCETPGWAETEGGGFVCLAGSSETEEASIRLPRLIRFVHPDPTEWDRYLETMRYDTNPVDRVDSMVPFIYAKRWRKWLGPNYSSASAFASGEPPVRRLGAGRKFHFIEAEPTDRGTVLVRDNGAVVPADKVHVYPLTKFHGWDLSQEPIPMGHLPAWAIAYDGTPVHTSPSHTAPVAKHLDYHTPILVEDEAVDRAGHWWMMPNGLGPGTPGYVNDEEGIRHWVPSSEAKGLTPGALWIDVDLDQQVLALRRGEEVEFVTLISSGAPGTATPRGIYNIQDKAIWTDMASRPASEDPYFVEKVPWVMHFKKRYALHGTFWHWGFGHTASHGCINLSVRDARWVFDRVSPITHGGWHAAVASQNNPGTVLRVRRGQAAVPDRRGG